MRRLAWSPIWAVLFILPCLSSAAIVLGGTRVIYPDDAREVSLQISNPGDSPSLIQSWIDDGNAESLPEDQQVPFMIMPPIARIEAGGGQMLRISYTGDASLPRDRETLFWLNVLDIPPAPESSGSQVPKNYLQLAFRSRIKLFLRPQGLSGRVEDAPARLQWSVTQQDGRPGLRVHNPTPYHVTMTQVSASGPQGPITLEFEDGMVAPGQSMFLRLPAGAASIRGPLSMTTINDFGGRVTRQLQVSLP